MRINISLPSDVIAKCDKEASRLGLSRSSFISLLIAQHKGAVEPFADNIYPMRQVNQTDMLNYLNECIDLVEKGKVVELALAAGLLEGKGATFFVNASMRLLGATDILRNRILNAICN